MTFSFRIFFCNGAATLKKIGTKRPNTLQRRKKDFCSVGFVRFSSSRTAAAVTLDGSSRPGRIACVM